MTAGTLSAETLTQGVPGADRADQRRGPGDPGRARAQPERGRRGEGARRASARKPGARGPLHGIPVLLDDSIDVRGLPTTGGSIALQDSKPAADAALVAKLKAAGAIILGKTNVSELNGLFDANMPEGYSSLGGQVLLPSDTDKTPAGSSGGSAAATAAGLAALTVGLETSTDTAQMIAPAGVAGVVGLKPTVGLVRPTGVLPVAKSQDAPGPIARTVDDAAARALEAMLDRAPAAYSGSRRPRWRARRSRSSAARRRRTRPVTALQALGRDDRGQDVGTPSPNPPSIVDERVQARPERVPGRRPGSAKSLQGIIDYNAANPVEGLKYQQGQLIGARRRRTSGAYAATWPRARPPTRAR